MFTLEIGGKPVAMIQADHTEAREFFGGQTFKDDMRRLLIDAYDPDDLEKTSVHQRTASRPTQPDHQAR